MLLRIIAVVSISLAQIGCANSLKKDVGIVISNSNTNFKVIKDVLENHDKRIKELEAKKK